MSGGREGLARVLRNAPDFGGWRAGMDDDDYLVLVDVVLDHLAAKASEVAVVEAVAEALVMWPPPTSKETATAALTAFLAALRGPQAAVKADLTASEGGMAHGDVRNDERPGE